MGGVASARPAPAKPNVSQPPYYPYFYPYNGGTTSPRSPGSTPSINVIPIMFLLVGVLLY
jgi:hypothetical protein